MNVLLAEVADKVTPIAWHWLICVASTAGLLVSQTGSKPALAITIPSLMRWAVFCFGAFDAYCDQALRTHVALELGAEYFTQTAISLTIPPSIGLAVLLKATRNEQVPAGHKL